MNPTDVGDSKLLIPNSQGVETMLVELLANKKLNYCIIKIGDKIYSTTFGKKAWQEGSKTQIQNATTMNISEKEKLIRIRGGKLTETNKHKKIDPVPFELDLYFGGGE